MSIKPQITFETHVPDDALPSRLDHEDFAALPYAYQRTLLNVTAQRFPQEAHLIDFRTGESKRTYALIRVEDKRRPYYAVGLVAFGHPPCIPHFENVHYGLGFEDGVFELRRRVGTSSRPMPSAGMQRADELMGY